MFMNKQSKKTVHPYAWLAVFSLAAAGVISITKKGSQLITEKASCVKDMMKNKSGGMKNIGDKMTKAIDDMMD